MITEQIRQAIEEFTPLYEEVTTSDLQGICEARAMKILRGAGLKDITNIEYMTVSDYILDGIYANVE